jgi:small subunit ribosomal protein S1
VRGYLADEGLYDLTIPGAAIEAADWSEIEEGAVVEASVTAANTGGLECKVGNIRGFIPASQIAPYRVENMAEYVGQKVLCVVNEANERRGNLILSRRAVLERERQEQKAQRLAAIEVGSPVKGTVRKITDFGAFVDIGGLDGLLHISQLSWERIKHPSEVLTEGQEIHVRVDKIDPQTGKIGLSYRSLQEHPWTNITSRFPVGSLVKGSVTRLADFGAFVRLATGVEGLVHLSELAHYRVPSAAAVVKEGQEVEVKVLSIEEDKQRISLSLKAAMAPPAAAAESAGEEKPEEAATPRRSGVARHQGPLKGGTGSSSGGETFGLKW